MVRGGVTVYATCTHVQVEGVRLTEGPISSRRGGRCDPCCHRAQFSQGSVVVNLAMLSNPGHSGRCCCENGAFKASDRLVGAWALLAAAEMH